MQRRSLQHISEQCEEDTSTVQTYNGVAMAMDRINAWEDSLAFNDICSKPTEDKTSCKLDYETFPHGLRGACLDVFGMYVTSSYTFDCTSDNGDTRLFYQGSMLPTCLGVSCGVIGANAIHDEMVTELMTSLTDSGMDCTRQLLDVDRPIVSTVPVTDCPTESAWMSYVMLTNDTDTTAEKVAAVSSESCVDDTESSQTCHVDFRPFAFISETTCGVVQGMYLEIDYNLFCSHTNDTDVTMDFFGSGDPLCISLTLCTQAHYNEVATNHVEKYMRDLETIGWECSISAISVEDFRPSAAPSVSMAPSVSFSPTTSPTVSLQPTRSPAPSSVPTEMTCLQGSIFLNETESIKTETLASHSLLGDESIQSYCMKPENTKTVEEVVSCTVDFTDTTHELLEVCVSDLDGMYVEDTATIHCSSATSQKRYTYVNRPACRNPKCNGVDVKDVVKFEMEWLRWNVESLEPALSCEFDSIKVVAGGSQSGNDDLTQCVRESYEVGTFIDVYNERQKLERAFKTYISVDLRQICGSPQPGFLWCDFDWTQFPNDLEDACFNNNGQPLESAFRIDCTKNGEVLNMTSQNVPGCIGLSCSPTEAEEFLETEQHLWLEAYFAEDGYDCSTVVIGSFTPNYVPPTDDDTVATSTPTAAWTDPFNTMTTAPKFGDVFLTDAPTSFEEHTTGSSGSELTCCNALVGVLMLVFALPG